MEQPPQVCLPHDTPDVKSCCGISVSQTVSIRWFIVMIAFVGICCAVVGTVLGAMKASGREHLTVSLLMIGQYHTSYQQSGRISVRILTLSSSLFKLRNNHDMEILLAQPWPKQLVHII